ncbi:hypothetical protein QWY31_14505 [Cytophagales bacterium LB-30]|uniref:Uncharacterized protein n=1 Tax=Shiella aurantiaca TaxID=3058365 RepID=A0ABT8F8Z0_9BACT|nr:hypothetical protein [Shiella aurantiaca]MDN4166719.1 hypothetical protein [Shiella aurantiaca]
MDKLDKEMQQWLAGQTSDSQQRAEEEARYLALYNALAEKPEIKIPARFAENVLKKLEAQENPRWVMQMWGKMAALFIITVASGILLALLGFRLMEGFDFSLKPYVMPTIFALILLFIIEYADFYWLKSKQMFRR